MAKTLPCKCVCIYDFKWRFASFYGNAHFKSCHIHYNVTTLKHTEQKKIIYNPEVIIHLLLCSWSKNVDLDDCEVEICEYHTSVK